MLRNAKKSIVLARISKDSHAELKAMTAELCEGASDCKSTGSKPSLWNKRFAASGKPVPAPKISNH